MKKNKEQINNSPNRSDNVQNLWNTKASVKYLK